MAADEAAPVAERTTSPQSAYTVREVAIGLLILAVGVAFVFGIPLAFT